MSSALSAEAITAVFNACFSGPQTFVQDRACMVRGQDEPFYAAPTAERPWGEVIYARGLAASCLHEAAHWLYAGRRRRSQDDYGYWYVPDGRNQAEQALFEQHEVPVQAIESVLAAAAGVRFHFSADNLASDGPTTWFQEQVCQKAQQHYCSLPTARLQRLVHAVAAARGLALADLPAALSAQLQAARVS